MTVSPRLLSAKMVSERTSLSRTTLWRLCKAGQFPASIRLSPQRVAWRESDVSAWLEAKAAR